MSENRITFEGGSVVDPGFKCSKCGEPFRATATIHDTKTDRLEQENAEIIEELHSIRRDNLMLRQLIRWCYYETEDWDLMPDTSEKETIERIVGIEEILEKYE